MIIQASEVRSVGEGYVRQLPTAGEDLVYEHDFNPALSKQFNFAVICGPAMSYTSDCVPDHTVPLFIRGMEVTLTENVEPIVPQTGGTLVAAGRQSGLRTITYSAFDHQSGLTRVEAVLGNDVVAARDLTPRCSYYDFTVCPSVDDGSLSVDTRAVPNGSHRLTVRVHDAAGNVRSVEFPNEIQVENVASADAPAGGVAGASGVAPGLRLAVSFVNSSRTSLIVPWGRSVTLRGRLTGTSTQGVGRAEIEVLERAARKGARERSGGRVQTDADGDFKYVLPGRRPSRTVKLLHRIGGGAPVVSRMLKLSVRAAATLRTSLRGVSVRYVGRVLSHPLPRGGKRIVLQGKAPGYAWAPFARLRTNRNGGFAGTYHLPVRRPGVVLRIRVVVPAERGYPYLSFTGRPVALRVR